MGISDSPFRLSSLPRTARLCFFQKTPPVRKSEEIRKGAIPKHSGSTVQSHHQSSILVAEALLPALLVVNPTFDTYEDQVQQMAMNSE
jgi:hypothetical protein